MKRFQSIIQKYITNHEKHKKYLAAVLALSVLVSFGVSAGLIMPAISMTNDDGVDVTPLSLGRAGEQMLDNYDSSSDNNGYSPAQRSVKELLIGSGDALDWANGAESPEEIAKKAEDTYFLGIAYDFCLFLEGNATLKDADAEGRVAVGGNLIFDGSYCYQVGAGNFGYMTALKDTDDYQGITGFAHAIVGGYMKNIHPLSTGNNKTRVNSNAESKGGHQGYGETLYFPPTEDEFKRFVVGDATNNTDATHMYCNGGEKYNVSGSHDSVAVNELAEMYNQPEGGIINFTSTFEWLRERSAALGEKKATGTVSTSGNTITFTIPEGMENADTVYFDLPEGVNYGELEEIKFVNVPKETTEMVVRETKSDELKTVTKNIPKCNLVINGLGDSFDIRGTGNTVKTTITYTGETIEDEISNTRDSEKRDIYNKNDYHNNNSEDVKGWRSNNHPASSKILYNFPNATSGAINGNFNGTIFAPNADVKSDNGCTGHLSGALIAKSFIGGLEFGYRPYRGTSDILGSKSGYVIPFDKFITGTDTHLSGASFEVTDESGNTVASWTSGDETQYTAIPTGVDFTGKTDYSDISAPIEHTYTVRETKAPTGFFKTDKEYQITVKENVDKNYLIPVMENNEIKGTIPQVVDVEVTIKQTKNDDGTAVDTPVGTFKFQIRDSYNENNHEQRKVVIYDGDNIEEVFGLNIENKKVTSVVKIANDKIGTGENQDATPPSTPNTVDNSTFNNPANTVLDSEETIVTEITETTTITETSVTTTTTETTEDITTEASETTETMPLMQNAPDMEEFTEEELDSDIILEPEDIDVLDGESTYGIINTVNWSDTVTGVDANKSDAFKSGDNNYYYDSKSMMVMPLPETTPSFENTPGLLFTKVDATTKQPISGAEIAISPEISGFDASSGSFLFDINSLGTDVYTLTETKAPGGYEIAKPVYLQKRDGKLYYGATNSPTNEIAKNENGYYSFTMEDIKISGAVPSLKKTDESGNVLAGATFELWAKDGTSAICTWENFDGKETSMKDELLKVTDTTYVENGFLKPGVYYLKETVIPKKNGKDYYEDPGDMYFTVNKDFTITNGYVDAIPLFAEPSGDHEIKFGAEGQKITNIVSIKWISNGVKSIYDTTPDIQDFDSGNFHNEYTYTAKTVSQKDGNNYAIKLANWGRDEKLEVSYVEIITDSGQKYIYNSASLMTLSYDDANGGISVLSGEESGISPQADDGSKSFGNVDVNGNGVAKLKYGDGNKTISHLYCEIEGETSIKTYGIKHGNDDEWGATFFTLNNGICDVDIADGSNSETIEIQPKDKWDGSFKVKLVRVTTTDGSVYVYDVNNPGGSTGGNTGDNPGGNTSGGERIENEHLTVTGSLLTVKNTRPGDNKSITVKKEWDNGEFTSGINSITVQLYRTTDTVDYDNLPTNDDTNKVGEIVTLSADGTTPWTYTWSNLPSYVDDSEAMWNYYVKEVNIPSGYTAKYSASGSEFTITNTLKKDTISITKEWEVASGVTPPSKPDKLKVTLKFTIGGTQKTATVELTSKNGSEDYTGSYDIPEGATDVSVEENDVPTGWKLKENGITGTVKDGFKITNVPDSGKLTVKKNWTKDKENNRPNDIYIAIYRTITDPNSPPKTDGNMIYISENNVSENNGITAITVASSSQEKIKSFYCKGTGADSINVLGVVAKGAGSTNSTLLASDVSEVVTYPLTNGVCDVNITNGAVLSGIQIESDVEGATFSVECVKVTTDKNNTYIYETSNNTSDSNSEIAYGAEHFDPDNSSLVPDYKDDYYKSNNVNQYNDYARLLQYSLYFYDANMCGSQVAKKSAVDWRGNCHTGGTDGGFHDAGDHTMFGLPQGFTASTLGWSYYEFKDSYDTLGLTDHYQKIMKHFCDFFVNSIKTENGTTKILVQKGQPDIDQSYWAPPEEKTVSDYGGETWVSSGAANIAAHYAAALAQYTLNFPDSSEKQTYLAKAKDFYDYAIANASNGGYAYNNAADNECKSEIAWASAWMYLANDNASQYKTNCESYLNGLSIHSNCYFYGDVAAGAMTVYASHINNTDSSWSKVKTYLQNNCTSSAFKVLDNWGSARHNTLLQTVALVASKNCSDIDYNEWCKGQMAYILGNNNVSSNGNSSTCFVTGFADNSPINLHHRAATGTVLGTPYDNWTGWNNWDGLYSSLTTGTQHTLVGALAGGNGDNSGYKDNCKDHVGNEVALDYNAGLVGAAAGLYDVYRTGKTYANDGTSYIPAQNNISAQSYNAPSVPTYDAEPQSDDTNVEEDVLDSMTFDNPTVDVMATEKTYTWTNDFANQIKYDLPSDMIGKKILKMEIYFNQTYGNKGKIKTEYNYNWNEIAELKNSISGVEVISVPETYQEIITNIICDNAYYGDFTVYKIVFYYVTVGSTFDVVSKQNEIIVGESTDLTITGATGTISWDLSNAGDCTIDGNTLVAGKNVGTFTISGTDEDGKTGTFTITVNPFTLTLSKSSVQENGEVTFTSNKNITKVEVLDSSGNVLENHGWTISFNEMAGTVKAGNTTGNFKIKAYSGDTITAQARLTVTGSEFTISPNPIQVRVGGTKQIEVDPNSGSISYTSSDTGIATVDNNGLVTGVGEGNTTITVIRNGVEQPVDVEVFGKLAISGDSKMNKNQSQKLTVNNIGDVTWSVTWNPKDPTKTGAGHEPTISPDGTLTAGDADGQVTVKVEDSNGGEAIFPITIELTAMTPSHEGMKFVQNVTLKKDKGYTETLDLPKTDDSGNPYYYYIVEVESAGGRDAVESVNGNNSAVYIPVGYDNNGSSIENGATLSVTNEKTPDEETPGYTLPSAGGKGVTWYYITGAALMCGAVVVLVRRRRRSA